jgi:HD-GYP domain-containing protein (c-di-GMP phosphodiesterase class II)
MQDKDNPRSGYNNVLQQDTSSAASLLTSTKDILTSLDLSAPLVKLAEALGPFIRVDAVSLKLNNLTEELLLLKRGDTFKQEIIYGSRITASGSFASEAMLSNSPSILHEIAANTQFSFPSYVAEEKFQSLVALPLTSGTRQTGILTIYLKESADVSSDVLAIVSIVANVTATAVENTQLVSRIEKNYFSTVEALTAAIEAKDAYTRGHSKRVTQFAITLAERFGVSETDIRNLQYGATLHDIGKIGISGKILNKNGRLTEAEYEVIKKHPVIGERIIERVDFLQGARPIVRGHHERFDGTGYPDGLRDEEIPFLARISAVVDFFDALTSDRPYRRAYSAEQALLMVRESIGREFDPVVAREFLEMGPVLAAAYQEAPVPVLEI